MTELQVIADALIRIGAIEMKDIHSADKWMGHDFQAYIQVHLHYGNGGDIQFKFNAAGELVEFESNYDPYERDCCCDY